MESPTLFLSHDPYYDYLSAVQYGRVFDGQPPSSWLDVGEHFAYWRPPRMRRPRGFHIAHFSEFDVEAPEVAAIWDGPRFDVPLLGLRGASAGEIVVAARAHLGEEPTINRAFFDAATEESGEAALNLWRACLETGDCMAHFALGYTLYELGRYREAYSHLRHYSELAPHNAWVWCWLGKGASAIGEKDEARRAYRRALELTAAGEEETDASRLLAELR